MTGKLGKYNTFGRERSYKNGKTRLGRKGYLKPGRSNPLLEFQQKKILYVLEKTDGGDYLAYYKKRTLIIRLAFEQYLLKIQR